jgi:hypothetical protein
LVRNDAAFQRLIADAAAARDGALKAFHEAGGERLLGLAAERKLQPAQ